MPRGPKVAIDVEWAINTLASEGKGPSQIEEHLSKEPAYSARLPSLRQIQRIVKAAILADAMSSS